MEREEIVERLRANATGDLHRELADAVRALPVIATCRQCASVGPSSGGWACEAMEPPGQVGGPLVEIDDAPPSWCPLRGKR